MPDHPSRTPPTGHLAPRPPAYFGTHGSPARRLLARAVGAGNRLLDRIPGTRALYRWILGRRLQVADIDVPLRRGHPDLAGLRVVFLSDLHAGSYLQEEDLDRLFARVAALAPDLVCFGGDLIHTRAAEIEHYARPLRHLSPPLGVFAVPGNHERFGGLPIEPWEARLTELGVTVLRNAGTRLRRGAATLWLAGVDDLTEGDPALDAALAGRAADEPALLLSHHPDLFAEAVAHDVDLTLAGHTHGGQVRPFGAILLSHSALGYHGGTYRENGCLLHVGRGVGAAILPVRWNADPEVPVLRLAPGGADGEETHAPVVRPVCTPRTRRGSDPPGSPASP